MAAQTMYAAGALRVIKGSRQSFSGIFENEPSVHQSIKRNGSDAATGFGNKPKKSRSEKSTTKGKEKVTKRNELDPEGPTVSKGPDGSYHKRQKRKAGDAGLCFDNKPKTSRSEKGISSGHKKEVKKWKEEEETLRTELKCVAIAGDMKDFGQKYEQHKKLGGGIFGIVFAGVRISDRQPVAIKYIKRKTVMFVPVHFENEVYNVPLEVFLMSKASPDQELTGLNPAVSFLDWFILDQNKIFLVMERPTPSEDLFIYSLENAPLPEEQAKVMIQQVVNALVDIHSKGVFHGDIKVDNLLVQTTESGPRMRIIDFGCGCIIKHPTFHNETLSFAPRQYKNRTYLAGPLTVTQIGSVLYELLISDDSELSPLDLMDGNISTRSDLSKECIDFLNFCITWDLEQRICLDQLRHHPWFHA